MCESTVSFPMGRCTRPGYTGQAALEAQPQALHLVPQRCHFLFTAVALLQHIQKKEYIGSFSVTHGLSLSAETKVGLLPTFSLTQAPTQALEQRLNELWAPNPSAPGRKYKLTVVQAGAIS